MRYSRKLLLTLGLSLLLGALLSDAQAKPRAHPTKSSYGGDALKPKTNLKLDGRSVESIRAGKYDSLSLGNGEIKGAKRLYSLPANFRSRAADSEIEMRYRQ